MLPSAAHPHLYHLHCDAAGVSRLPQRVPGDGSTVLTAAAGPIVYRDATQTDTMFCNGWHDAFPATCPPPSFSAAAGTTLVDATSRGTVATVSVVVAGNTASSPWKMSSPPLFTAPVQSAAIQPVPRFFQPLFSPDVVQAPVKFTGGPMPPPPPDCTGRTGNTGGQDGCGDGPIGKRFIPCWHSVAANTTSTLTVSASTQTGAVSSKCLSASPVVSMPSSAANVFSPVKADKLPPDAADATCSTATGSVGPIADCRLDVCDNDEDEDEDDESISDESSSTSNQKDGGKYCECWRCEFFGHADVRLRSFVLRTVCDF